MFRSLILAAFVTAVRGQGCSICGDGLAVTNPDAIFTFPGFPAVPCGLLEQAGQTGAIPLDQCPFLPPLVGDCECAPVPAPIGCSVCGDGLAVTNPDAIFAFPGSPTVPCGILEQAGQNGGIPLDQCPLLADLIGICECAPGPPTPTPITSTGKGGKGGKGGKKKKGRKKGDDDTEAPTYAPVSPPTVAPVAPPTSGKGGKKMAL